MGGRYQAYPEYKNSEVEWLDEIPSHWKMIKLSFGLRLRSGDTITSESIEPEGSFPVYGGNGIRGFTKTHNCEGHYVLIGRQGALCGNINQASGKFFASEHAIVVYSNASWNTRYLAGMLEFMNLGQYSVSAAQPGVSVERLNMLRTICPPLPEQTQIARFLDHETAKIDRLIEKQQALIALLKEKRQAVISHAVTKGLNPHAPLKDSGIEWLGQVPADWKVSKLKYYATMRGGFAFSSDLFQEDGVQLLRIGNVYLNQLELDRQPVFLDSKTTKTHPDFVIQKGDIIMSLTGTLGKTDYGFAVIVNEDGPFLLNQRVGKITPAMDRVLFDYLLYSVRSSSYQSQLYSLPSGTKQANLSNSDVLKIVVAVPMSVEEQRDIVKYVTDRLTTLDELIARAENATTLLQERRTALISAAVTGKIDVRAWQPAKLAPSTANAA